MMNKRFFQAGIGLALLAAQCAYAGRNKQPAALPEPAAQTTGLKAGEAGSESADRPALHQRHIRYFVQRIDTLAISFPLVPEYDQTVTVQPDGFVSLVGIGDVHVEGLTLPELREKLRQAYAKILHDPIVTVDLKDFQRPYFTALGQVGKPGKYELREDTTVTEAVALAGGFTAMAKHSQVVLFRRVSQEWSEARTIDLKKMLEEKNLAEDIHLQPGDILYVPQNMISKIRPFVPYEFVLGLYRAKNF